MHYIGLVVYTFILGLLDGSFIGLMSIMTFRCTGSAELMSDSWGISLMFMSCSMLIGPPTVGKLPWKKLILVDLSQDMVDYMRMTSVLTNASLSILIRHTLEISIVI